MPNQIAELIKEVLETDYVKAVFDELGGPIPVDPPKPELPPLDRIDDKNPKALTAQEQKKVKDFLKVNKHDSVKAGKLDISTDVKVRDAMLTVHGVTAEQYRAAGGSA